MSTPRKARLAGIAGSASARMLVAVVAVVLGAGGCATQPGAGPQGLPELPAAWTMAQAAPAGSSAPRMHVADATSPWWHAVDDPLLHRLLAQAGEVSSVRIARERLDEAAAALRVARAALAPLVTGAGDGRFTAPGDDAVRQSTRGAAIAIDHDFDLSGARDARSRSARALAEARADGVDAARIAAREMTVRLYAAYASAVEQRQVALVSVQAFEDALSMAAARARAGLGTQVDVVQARAALTAARASLPQLEAARTRARLGLEALLGLLPGALAAPLGGIEAVPAIDLSLPLRAPLEVVALRPDLRVAERELAAAASATSAAVRDRWPRLTLSALLGVQSVRVPGPIAADGVVSSLVAGIAGPLFDAGRLEAAADAARARERIAAIAYRQAAIVALSEVEDGISGLTQAHAEDGLKVAAVEAAAARLALAGSRWRSGLSPFLDVVLAQQALQSARAQHVLSRARMLETFARLSTAVGIGG